VIRYPDEVLRRFVLIALLLVAPAAQAVIVRGKVTDVYGRPLPGSRVQLISLAGGARNAADTISGLDGSYELRTDLAGRFLLLTSPSINAHIFAPQLGRTFYGGRTDLLTIDVALDGVAITPQVSAQTSLTPVPLAQLSTAVTQIDADRLVTEATVLPGLAVVPGGLVVQLGQTGQPAQLYLRGSPVDKVTVDGVAAERLGGGFNLSTLTTSGLSAVASVPAIEVAADANPLKGVDAQAGTLSVTTAGGASLHPVLVYSGDAGNLSTVRNEGVFTVSHSRADALLSFARFNTDNDLPAARIHLVSWAANGGYRISGNTSLRATLRDDVSAVPLASPYDFYQVAPATRLASQNLYGGAVFDTTTTGGWRNRLRYGLARERAEAFNFATPAVGSPVTIRGANGFTASGTAAFLPVPAREDFITDRNEYTYQTGYPFKQYLHGLLTASYEDERGADLTAAQPERLARSHFSVAGSVEFEMRHRFFADASGLVDHASALGWHGAPRMGLTYAAVRQGTRRFRGTTLHLTAATGFSEPSVAESAQIARPAFARSRTFEASIDQSILPRRLTLRAAYFHNQLSHQVETIAAVPLALSNALAYRTQGLASELRLQASPRFSVAGGYTYLAALVEQTAAAAALNPALPGIGIGATTALLGGRPFHRPPNTGFVRAQYNAHALTATVQAAFAGKSDDSTGLVLNPALLLPNRNLSPGFAALDAGLSFNLSHAITLFTQLDNLADSRHIAPLGYLSTPFSARVGVRIRLGRE
jgi:iron complex outermembrane receptor protein/vitamin B12 transporter